MTPTPSPDPSTPFSEEYRIPEADKTSPARQEKMAAPLEPSYITMPPVDKPRWSNIRARILSRD